MKAEESDNESVESGSCTCSDYDPDCSWFYDSRTLETSYMRFYIYGITNKNNIINKNKPLINRREETRNNTNNTGMNKNNKIEEINIDNNLASNSKRKNVIKITRRSPYRNSGVIQDDHSNKSKLFNKADYAMKKNNNNDSMELALDNNTNNEDNNNNNNNNNERKVHKTYMPRKYIMGNYSIPSFKDPEFNIDKNEFFQENDDDFEQKLAETNDKFNQLFMANNFMSNLQRSPEMTKGRFYKRRENRVEYKTEQKPKISKINVDINKAFDSPNKNYDSSFSNINFFSEENKDGLFNSNSNSNYKNRNVQTRGRTIKEKIVKEIKNITLQPGQSIKPKIITKRKLKPVTNIIKNDDGSQNIITENTTLTTIIINEFIDSSKIYQDDYPLDVQLVKQHITKIYKIETENNTCLPK
jgi:hypothetical protein